MKEKSYHIGKIIRDEMTVYACCRLVPKENVLFEYVEVEYEDGSCLFYYQDEEGFEHCENNFHSKRFTSYHEFFTTKELAVEERGSLKLKYYVRRSKDQYVKTDLSEKIKSLSDMASSGSIAHNEDCITQYGQYATCAE